MPGRLSVGAQTAKAALGIRTYTDDHERLRGTIGITRNIRDAEKSISVLTAEDADAEEAGVHANCSARSGRAKEQYGLEPRIDRRAARVMSETLMAMVNSAKTGAAPPKAPRLTFKRRAHILQRILTGA